MPFDVFVSYCRRDNESGLITRLYDRINAEFQSFADRELVRFLDIDEITGGDAWPERLLVGLRESSILLVFISPSYLASGHCRREFVEYVKHEVGHLHGFNGVVPIYLVEVPDWNTSHFDETCADWVRDLRQRQHFDFTACCGPGLEDLHQLGLHASIRDVARRLATTITRAEGAGRSLGNVDGHNPHFIGRGSDLYRLRENFVKPGTIGIVTAVNGIAGLGKTALAVEYAHAFAHEYGGGRWQIRCAGKSDLRLAVAELSTSIGFEFTEEEKKDSDRQFERTCLELKSLAKANQPNRCLLILDNVDRPELLDPTPLARLNGGDWLHIIATTRLGENELYGTHRDRTFLAVDELPADDALALIESYQANGCLQSDSERFAASDIVQLLGCFTLAVESAAVFLGQFSNDVSCEDFLARLKKEGIDGLDHAATQGSEAVLHGEKRLRATLMSTLERLSEAEKLTLAFAALLPPDQVLLHWLRPLVSETHPEMNCEAERGHPDPWKKVVRRLQSLCLFRPTSYLDKDLQPLVVRVHRVVGEIVRASLGGDPDLEFKLIRFLTHRLSHFPEIVEDEYRWELSAFGALTRLWIERPPVSSSTCKIPLQNVTLELPLCRIGGLLAHEVGYRLYKHALYSEALPLLRLAVESVDDNEIPNFLKAHWLSSLGRVLHSVGQLQESQTLCEQSLSILQTAPDSEPTYLVDALRDLGGLMLTNGEFHRAESLFRDALEVLKTLHNADHEEVGRTLNDIARVLRKLGRETEAEETFRLALRILENSLGKEHYNVGSVLNNLALLLQEGRHYQQAEELLRQATAIFVNTFGVKHPEVANSLNSLAVNLSNCGQVIEAEEMFRESLAILEAVFGADQPETEIALHNLGDCLFEQSKFEEGEIFLRRALTVQLAKYHLPNSNIANTKSRLASLLARTDQFDEAIILMQEVLSFWEARKDKNNSSYALALSNFGDLLRRQGRLDEAEYFGRRACERMKDDSDIVPLDYAEVLYVFAKTLSKLSDYSEAELKLRTALEIRDRLLGVDHPDTIDIASDLGMSLCFSRKLKQAEQLQRRVLESTRRVSGEDSSKLVESLNNLGVTLQALGKLSESREILQAALDTHQRLDIANGLTTATIMNTLAMVLRAEGSLEAAESLYKESLERLTSVGALQSQTAAFVFDNFAVLLMQMNRLSEAENCSRKAFCIFEAVLGPDHPDTVICRTNLDNLLSMIHSGVKLTFEGCVASWVNAMDTEVDRPKIGRNSACPCGSGNKFKKCCGNSNPPDVR